MVFRKLNAAVLHGKFSKYINGEITLIDLMNRSNIACEKTVQELVDLHSDSEAFKDRIKQMNGQILRAKSTHNMNVLAQRLLNELCKQPVLYTSKIHILWSDLPKYLIPDMMSYGTYLACKRKDWIGVARRLLHSRRKRFQIETISSLLDGAHTRVLDLCGGRGDLALYLAYMNPSWSVSIWDRNACAIQQARYRAEQLGLNNLKCRVIDLFNYEPRDDDNWDIVIGLHACGPLTDLILNFFAPRAKQIFIATCCFGKTSFEFSNVADSETPLARHAKLVINSKRIARFECARILEVDKLSFSTKNQILHVDNR